MEHKTLILHLSGTHNCTTDTLSDLERDFGYRPQTTLAQGLQYFAEWYRWWEGQKAE